VIGGAVQANIPLDFYSGYVQDDWRATTRLTVNAGVRYDYVSGMPLDQSRNPNFQVMQAAGAAGRFAGTVLDEFGTAPKADRNNIQPRVGFAYDVMGNGRDVVRAGWGLYTDFAYTNQNALNAAIDAQGGGGFTFIVSNPAGIRKSDGSFFRASDPLSTIAAQNQVNPNIPPLAGQVQSPLLEQPYNATGQRWLDTPARLVNGAQRGRRTHRRTSRQHAAADQPARERAWRYPRRPGDPAELEPVPRRAQQGTSLYQAFIIGLNRRMSRHLDVSASYTLANATSIIGSSSDETDANLVQDVRDPFASVQNAPLTRTDARHRGLALGHRRSAVRHRRRADLPISVGAADALVRRARPQRRRQHQRQDRDRGTGSPA